MQGEPRPLVEREAEIAAIGLTLRPAAANAGSALVIEGPAGIGKTALLRDARERAAGDGFTVFHARGGSQEIEYPYGVVRQLFGRSVRLGDPLLDGAAAMAAPGLGLESEGDAEEFSISHGLFWLVSNLSERTPVALIVDDLQWVDAPSVRFLLFLIRRLEDLPVAVIAGTRSTDAPLIAELCNEPSVGVVRPQLLSPIGSAAVVRARTSATATEAFEDACHSATGGNPHLLRELLVSLEADELPPDDRTAVVVPTMTPEGVSRSVLVRLASLDAVAARLAHAIAILGDAVEVRHAAALADLSVDRTLELVDDLVRISLLAPGPPLDVVHPLIGEVLRADMSDAEQRRLHGRAARLLFDDGAEPQRVAAHLDRAEPAGEPWVVDVLREAAVRARAEAVPQTARRWLERALVEGVQAQRFPLLVELGEVLTLLSEVRSAIAVLREALRLATDDDARAKATLLLGRAHLAIHEHDEAQAVFEEHLRSGRGDADTLIRVRGELSWTVAIAGSLDETAMAEELEEFVQSSLGGAHAIEALSSLALWHMVRGRFVEAVDASRRATEDPVAAVETLAEHRLHSIVNVLTVLDEHDRAREILERWRERARRRGSVQEFASTDGAQAVLEWHAGGLDACDTLARTAIDSGGLPDEVVPVISAFVALVAVERGELDEALAVAENAVDHAHDPAHIALYARARSYRGAGRFAEALADLERIEAIDAEAPGSLVFPPWRVEMIECALERRDTAEAARWLAEQEERIRTFGPPSAVGATERLRALLASGDDRLRGLRSAVEILAGAVDRREHARALVDLGAALRGARDRDAAQRVLRDGVDLAERCGAKVLVRRALDELAATGARPRRARVTGVEALTGAERRVATLAATDPSNASVAQSLFLTKSTVEKHLTSAYRKLGIRSRAELAVALGDR